MESLTNNCEQNPTTTCKDDADVKITDLGRTIAEDDVSVLNQSMRDFLGKPYLVGQLPWSAAKLPADELFSLQIGSTLISNPYWVNKMQGFSMFRGTAVIRVALNANPFQAGRLLGHFLPCAMECSENDPSFLAMHNANLTTMSQHPNIEINARDAAGIMKIPYVTPANWFDIRGATLASTLGTNFDWGVFYLNVLSPLKTGAAGSTVIDVSVYLHFEDVELAGPMVPQSGLGKTHKPTPRKWSVKSVKRRTSMSYGEEEAYDDGKPVTSALRAASKAGSILSSVPLLGPVITPLAWAADIAAGITSALGWSKPLHTDTTMSMWKQGQLYGGTSTGAWNSVPLALRHDHSISLTDTISIRGEDEMSFDFLKRIPAYMGSFEWSDSTLSGNPLLSARIGPDSTWMQSKAFTKIKGGQTATIQTLPPFAFLSQYFQMWRGSIIIILKFVKTDYHTGRIQVTWTPWWGSPFTTPTLSTSTLALREIIDLRESDTVELSLPFMYPNNYMDVRNGFSGQLDILVLNELRCPETAATSIDCVYYLKAGDDFELACPGKSWGGPVMSPQMGDNIAVSEVIGHDEKRSMTSNYAASSVGEMFTSVRQLIIRNCALMQKTLAGSANSTMVWPWMFGVSFMDATGVTGPNSGGDMISAVASMYAFYRGSMHLTFTNGTHTNVSSMGFQNCPQLRAGNVISSGFVMGDANNSNWPTTGSWVNNPYAASVMRTDTGNAHHSARVPYQSKTRCSLVQMQTVTNLIPPDSTQPLTMLNCASTGFFSSYAIHRSVADDFQFGYFLNAPPVLRTYV